MLAVTVRRVRTVINVCFAGITGWAAQPIVEAIGRTDDLVLTSGVSRSAAGQSLVQVTGKNSTGLVFATVAEALALVANLERIDAAVLDINLRGKLAYPVVDALRDRGVPVVFMTGYDDETILQGYRDIPCLRKPVAIERVIDAIGASGTSEHRPTVS